MLMEQHIFFYIFNIYSGCHRKGNLIHNAAEINLLPKLWFHETTFLGHRRKVKVRKSNVLLKKYSVYLLRCPCRFMFALCSAETPLWRLNVIV
jgi:hypothetical protein